MATLTHTVRHRPPLPAAQYAQLHREILQWHGSLGAPAAVLELSTDLSASGREALAHESAWQQSSERFSSRLARVFSDFEDVCGPLRLALYEVKHGLRVQAAASNCTAIHDLPRANADAAHMIAETAAAQKLMRSLLIFPQRPPAMLVQPLASGAYAAESDSGDGENVSTAKAILEVTPGRICPSSDRKSRQPPLLSWQASNITTPSGLLSMSYDERGNEYPVPGWALVEPINLATGPGELRGRDSR